MDRTKPDNLIPLIDGDILRYEIGFAAETGWRAITEDREAIPPFDYVEKVLLQRLNYINECIGTKETPRIFLTEGRVFREDIAITKPYKGTRKDNKPWHYANLSVYLRDVLGAEVVTTLEADDRMSIEHTNSNGTTIICSRDKDLRQVPGWFFSWELGLQPSYGPTLISNPGTIELSEDRKKIIATGLVAFYGQVLTGDRVDNIPGLDKCGPVAAYSILTEALSHDETIWPKEVFMAVQDAYDNDELLLEQGRLCWMTRRLHSNGEPVLWELGMES